MCFVSTWLVLITAEEFLREVCIVAPKDCVPRITDESLIEGHVVDRTEDRRQDFVGGEKMMDVGSAEAACAGITVT
jgi:hypothetical protein